MQLAASIYEVWPCKFVAADILFAPCIFCVCHNVWLLEDNRLSHRYMAYVSGSLKHLRLK